MQVPPMSFWDDIEDVASSVGDAFKGAADAVGGAIVGAANAVGQAVSGAVESVGHGAAKALRKLGRAARKIPGIGQALERAAGWAGDVVSSVTHFVAVVIKGVLGAAAGVVAGVIRVIGGAIGAVLTGDGSVVAKGLGNIGFGIGGGILIIVGGALGLVQTIIVLQGEREPLARDEHEILQRIFRRSVAYSNVRVVRGWAGLFSIISSKPVTIGNTIYLKSIPPEERLKQLVHECGHVWQYQHEGANYTAEAQGAQWTLGEKAYDWTAEVAKGKHRWKEFNVEAQAELFEDAYMGGRRTDLSPPGAPGDFFIDDPIGPNVKFVVDKPDDTGHIVHTDHTNLARESTAYVRSAFNWSFSH
jgi:hypothetical protein